MAAGEALSHGMCEKHNREDRQMADSERLKAAVRAVKAELVDYPEVRQMAWNIAAAALRAADEAESRQ